jgi:RND superfamily putative drug exporter
VLLLLAFRSFVLPFQAIFMNLLTPRAAFGSAVWVFQEGHGAGLFDVERTGFIQVILPFFAFALVFGLSMDYEVFMLSRMREEWSHTRDDQRAVQHGITRTARVITAAAAIMVAVFSSFMFTRSLEITQMGFMLGLAVLIDATIVRLLLVPALMRLVGSWNWVRRSWATWTRATSASHRTTGVLEAERLRPPPGPARPRATSTPGTVQLPRRLRARRNILRRRAGRLRQR